MDDSEQRNLARRLSEVSDRLDFSSALTIVQMRPIEAQEILDMYAEMARREEEHARGLKQLRQALIEDYG